MQQRERESKSRLYRCAVFQGSTGSCKHVETIRLSCKTFKWSTLGPPFKHHLSRLRLRKLMPCSSVFRVQDCNIFLNTAFDCSCKTLPFVLQSENNILFFFAHMFPNTVLSIFGTLRPNLVHLVQHSLYILYTHSPCSFMLSTGKQHLYIQSMSLSEDAPGTQLSSDIFHR